MTHWPWLILVTAYGACVGSFLNVVIFRMPKGKSLIHPGSHDPATGDKLQWWENIPIFSWLALRGKSRYTGERISLQYPLVEAFTAVAFGGLYLIYYHTDVRPEFSVPGFFATWPVLAVHLTLVAGLIAATMIDFRHYIIPIQIPYFITATALIVLPGAAALGWLPNTPIVLPPAANTPMHLQATEVLAQAAPTVDGWGLAMALGGWAGLLLAFGLLQANFIPRSFMDDDAPDLIDQEDPEAFLAYPHPRREVSKELMFVAFPLLGMILGFLLAPRIGLALAPQDLPMVWQVLGGSLGGFLVGGGIVWFTRILGTLAFGKEAMGLGDVHLMAAVGAVIGAIDTTVAFFIAPFFGLLAAVLMVGLTALLKGKKRMIPYGPYLAGAAVVVMIFRLPILRFLGILV